MYKLCSSRAICFALSSLLSFFASVSIAEEIEKTHSVEITVTGHKVIAGTTMVAIYNHKKDFDSNLTPLKGASRAVSYTNESFTFDDLPSGDYAIKLFQDVNDNGYLDFASTGIPTEPWGLSSLNTQQVLMRAPQFEDAVFSLHGDMKMTVQLR